MKRILALLMCLALTLSLFAACASDEKKNAGAKTTDVASLTATELYARAADNMNLLPSYELETVVIGGDIADTWITRRVRQGLDRFAFSRTKKDSTEGVYFNGETAWILSPEGNFTAPASTVNFQSFWSKDSFPVTGLDMAHFIAIERSGMTVTYSEADEQAIAAFNTIADFPVTGIQGKAVVDEQLFISEEEITLTGADSAGKERTLTIATKMLSHGEKDFAVAAVPEGTPCMEVSDISLPAILQKTYNVLASAENVSLTLVLEEVAADITRSAALEFNGVSKEYSVLETAMLATPGGDPLNTLTHSCCNSGSVRRVVTDVATEEVISDEIDTAAPKTAAAALASLLPALKDFKTASLTEDASTANVSVILSKEASSALVSETLSRLGLDPATDMGELTVTGTIAITKSTGAMTSFFYEVTAAEGVSPVTRRASFALTYGNAAVAEITTPVPETTDDAT